MKTELWSLNLLCSVGLMMALAPELFERGSPALIISGVLAAIAVAWVVGRSIIRIYQVHRKVSSLVLTERDWRPGDPPMSGFVWTPLNVVCGAYVCRSHTAETGHPLSDGSINDVARIVVGTSENSAKPVFLVARLRDGRVLFHVSDSSIPVCRKRIADWLNHRKLVPMSFQLLQQAFDVVRSEFDQTLITVRGGVK